ncbi:MAG: FAD-dependent oxidoreductase [Candidatus Thermoplasmatota archaeon]|jgi:glutamate synthase (NADPH/NADH) small chain|nr:FAD-dependent oxidoreductase [Candidatus Thermoplasmatota archaeon]
MYEAIPVETTSELSLNFNETNKGYTKEESMIEASRCLTCVNPTCVRRCPAHLHVPGYMKQIAKGNFQEALKVVYNFFPIAGTCGRICFHPCMEDCLQNRTPDGYALRIPMIRRAAADFGDINKLIIRPGFPTGKKVAIIGAGPAGLTCAYHLRRLGHDVTIFDKEKAPGGQLYYTIPKFRLPKDVLINECSILTKLGVIFKFGVNIGKDVGVEQITNDFDAVFIAIGAMKPITLNIPGEECNGVMHSLDFLKEVNEMRIKSLHGSVSVIGGGNVAIDVLRTVIRLSPDELHIIYRRSPREMPASKGEIREFIEEVVQHHVDIKDVDDAKEKFMLFEVLENEKSRTPTKVVAHFYTQPVKFSESAGKLTSIISSPVRLVNDPSNPRGKLIVDKDTTFELKTDMVIIAAGERPDVASLNLKELKTTRWNTIVVDNELKTSISKVFAGGDVTNGPASMIEAIRDGKNGAYALDKFLMEHVHN